MAERGDGGAGRRLTLLRMARDVLGADPRAPMSAIGRAAGMGMSQLYRLFPSKGDLLRALADDTHRIYAHRLRQAHDRLDAGEGAFEVYAEYLRGLVSDGALTISTQTPGMAEAGFRAAQRWSDLAALNESLFERVCTSGALREGVSYLDAAVILRAVSAVRGHDPDSSHDLRLRTVAVLVDGLRSGLSPLEGRPPDRADLYQGPD